MPREERRFRLTLHYDGSHFFGWQVQPEERTVQGELQATLERLTGAPRTVTAAGRTDRGVHATGQVVTVTLPLRWTADSVRGALNALLPRDIWVAEAAPAPPRFHPRYDATAREYGYRLGLSARSHSPFHRTWCWPLAAEVNVEALHAAAALLPGEQSFAAFARAGQEERGNRCDVLEARWAPWALGMEFTVVANRFLHRMVRYLVGTMVDVARGRRPIGEMRALLAGTAPELVTSPPAPPAGLFLRRVTYPVRTIACSADSPAAGSALDPALDDSASGGEPATSARSPLLAGDVTTKGDTPPVAAAVLDSVTHRPTAGSANNP